MAWKYSIQYCTVHAAKIQKNENTQKNKKNNNLLKTKIILNIKISAVSAKVGPVFAFTLPGGPTRPPAPASYATAGTEIRSVNGH